METNTKYTRARALRYKRPALASLGYEFILQGIQEVWEACEEVVWFEENEEDLIAALDGDEDEAFEFRMAFADLDGKASLLYDTLRSTWNDDVSEYFDDCVVALLGNRYKLVGYDTVEEDYFSLTSYECKLAETEAGKRVMRWTKADMLSKIGQCMGIVLSYIDLRQSYDCLRVTMDILRDENTTMLQTIKDIETEYERCMEDSRISYSRFDGLTRNLPDRVWIE